MIIDKFLQIKFNKKSIKEEDDINDWKKKRFFVFNYFSFGK